MFRISLQNHSAAASAGIRAAGAAVRTFSTVKEIADQQRKEAAESAAAGGETKPQGDPLGSLTPAQLKATQENLPVFLEAIWHVSVVDIERTLTAVTHKVSEPRRADRSPRMHALTTACDRPPRSCVAITPSMRAHGCSGHTPSGGSVRSSWRRRSLREAPRWTDGPIAIDCP
jgi:hypothetical protein